MLGPTSPAAPITHGAIRGAEIGGWGAGGSSWGQWDTLGTPIGGQWDAMGTMGWGWGQPKGDNVTQGPTSPPVAPVTHGALHGAQARGWGGGDIVGTMGRLGDTHRGTMGWGWGQPKGDNVMLGPTSPPAAPIAHGAICGAQVGGWGGVTPR